MEGIVGITTRFTRLLGPFQRRECSQNQTTPLTEGDMFLKCSNSNISLYQLLFPVGTRLILHLFLMASSLN